MASLTTLRPSLTVILEAIKTELVSSLSVNAEKIRIVTRKSIPNVQGDDDILIRPRGFTTDPGHDYRSDFRINRHVEVIPRSRDESDEIDEDRLWYIRSTDGHAIFEEDILNALHLEYPVDTDGNAYLVQPMRCIQGLDPERIPEGHDWWGSSCLVFEVIYELNLDQTIQ